MTNSIDKEWQNNAIYSCPYFIRTFKVDHWHKSHKRLTTLWSTPMHVMHYKSKPQLNVC